MAEIDVHLEYKDSSMCKFDVVVTEDNHTSHHVVTVNTDDYNMITGGRVSYEELIKEAFNFLLSKESHTSVLDSFDLVDITSYYPEFIDEIKKRFGHRR